MGLKNGSEDKIEYLSPEVLSNADGYIWRPAVVPDGLAFATDGTLSGKPTTAGAAGLVAQVKDTAGAAATNYFPLAIAENANEAPVVTGLSPAAEGATVKAGDELAFTVTARDPEGRRSRTRGR